MARAKKKGDDRFQPAPGTRRVVPMRDGAFTVHTPDGRARRVERSGLPELVVELDKDDRTPGWYRACLVQLGEGAADLVAAVDDLEEGTDD
jgi:hypothetical protein